jgi:hypothetical protein
VVAAAAALTRTGSTTALGLMEGKSQEEAAKSQEGARIEE